MTSFKALNGGDKQPEAPASVEDRRPGSSEQLNHTPTQSQATPATESRPKSSDAPAPPRGAWTSQSQERAPYLAHSYPEAEAGLKRKRSDSVERRREGPPPAPAATQEQSPPRELSEQPRHQASRDREAEQRRYEDDRERWYNEESRDASKYDGQSATPVTRTPVAAESGHDGDFSNASPDGDERSMVYAGSPYGNERHDGVVQSDQKKRKRNFSNRTKTGCFTCRRRKKKCDETKPECQNCTRGGFVCAGYPAAKNHVWPKQDQKQLQVPLESKDPMYVPPGAYGMPQQQQQQQQQQQPPPPPLPPQQQQQGQGQPPQQAQQNQSPVTPFGSQLNVPGPHPPPLQKRESLVFSRGQPLRIDPPQGRPILTDDDRATASTMPSASVASPDNKLSALTSYTTPATAFPTPISANQTPSGPFSEMRKDYKEYQRVPPLHDLSRNEPETPHPGNTLPHINVIPTTRTNSPITKSQAQHSSQSAVGGPSTQATAQMALSHSYGSSGRPRTQKEEMLAGRHFYPFERELCLERERCNAACWRFNNASNPNNGIGGQERSRLFREILQPRDPLPLSPSEQSNVTKVGNVGENVVVEAPFTCDYGYNITIGQNVVIGRNCTITDACDVKIGDNVHIGPNVSIYTNSLPIDPKRRMGSKGPQFGRPIVIEQDCWIGGGATILPGRTVGKGSTVGAGAIVTKDVPPFTIVVGNPARVLRGVST